MQIEDNTYRFENAKVFFVPKGTAVEMYQTTLHLSPCRVCDAGFKGVVILPKGTNTPLEDKTPNGDPESKLLLQRNKWSLHTRSVSRSSSRALTPACWAKTRSSIINRQDG